MLQHIYFKNEGSRLLGAYHQPDDIASARPLGIIMILDMITGFARATRQQAVSSTEMGWRGIKKLLTITLVIMAAQLDRVLGDGSGHVLRDALIIYYIVVEALSVLENTAACGVPYPEWLTTVLKQLNERKAQPLPPPET